MKLQGKVALVTGGAVRIGKAITLMLAQAGAHVVVNYHSSAVEAEATMAEAQALGVEALAVKCDVADWEAVQAMAHQVTARWGGVDVLVNSAGYFGKITVPTDDLETWRRVTRISIDGAFYVTNALAPAMLSRGGGAIVNIVDLSAWTPWPGFTAHAVGKAGLLALTHQLALELAPSIRVNAVAPGPVMPPPNTSDSQNATIAARTLLNRWGSGEDVAGAVRYLIEAEYVTGETLFVDGGEHLAQYKRRS
ncbi:MAG: SDR family oxidoreductase [Anaerolineales bacterium]|nr:SDR family oxidoreductase [Anaerolineales bacterium]